MTYLEIRNAISVLNLLVEANLLNRIIDDIALNKQFTQKDLRDLKNHCPNIAEFFKVVKVIQKQTPDLIIVSDDDAF